jgi:drug/metabolite transporter (DMT)-like permease
MMSLEVSQASSRQSPGARIQLTAALRGVDWRVLLAFSAIYFLWGATFLAIRIAVLEVPPFLTAGLRFFIAGATLYGVMRLRGAAAPSLAEWRNIALTAVCLFVLTYGALFWAEQYVPSGITAVIEATLPITIMVLEVFVFRLQPFRWPMLAAVALGFGGVIWLLATPGADGVAVWPCLVILAGGIAWSVGAVLTRALALPSSRPLTAGAQMMLGGATLLAVALGSGELQPLPHVPLRAALAMLYLIVGGSLLGFTAYVWLLARLPATTVASHAYVNPVVAVLLGYLVGGESLSVRTLFAAALVVASVLLILRAPPRQRASLPAQPLPPVGRTLAKAQDDPDARLALDHGIAVKAESASATAADGTGTAARERDQCTQVAA